MGFWEWMIVLLIVLVVFGSTKLPQLGDGLGKFVKNFKRGMSAADELEVSPKKATIEGGEAGKDKPATPSGSTTP